MSETLSEMSKRHEEELTDLLKRETVGGANFHVSIVHMRIEAFEDREAGDHVDVGTTMPPADLGRLFRYLALRYQPRNTEDRKQRT